MWSALHNAAHQGDAEGVRRCLDAQEPSTKTARGDLPIHLSAHGAHTEALTMLARRSRGAEEVNEANDAGWTPLMLVLLANAPPARRFDCLQLLLSLGASCTAMAPGGWSALLLAAQKGDAAALSLLMNADPVSAAALIATPNSDGDTALHLAAHVGSDLCVWLLLSAGVAAEPLNNKGLDAMSLAVSAVCSTDVEATDEVTARFERTLAHLAAAATPASAQRSVDRGLLHTVAAAPQAVGQRRLMSVAAALRRHGYDDNYHDAAHGSAADLATRCGRRALAALLRAPPPARLSLLCVREPIEESAPESIVVAEGALDRPSLGAEAVRLRHAVLRAMRSVETAMAGDHAPRPLAVPVPNMAADSAESAAAMAEEEMVAAAAAAAVGGGRRRWRTFRRLAHLPPSAGNDDVPAREELLPCLRQATFARAAAIRTRPPADVLAYALLEGSKTTPATCSAAALATGRVTYRQHRRWSDGGDPASGVELPGGTGYGTEQIEVIELVPQAGVPLLHDIHLELLRGALGDTLSEVLNKEFTAEAAEVGGAAGGRRQWVIYAEDLTAVAPDHGSGGGGGGSGGGKGGAGGGGSLAEMEEMGVKSEWPASGSTGGAPWHAVAEVFSLDTPLLLAFAGEATAAQLTAEVAGSDSEDGLDDGHDDGHGGSHESVFMMDQDAS